VDNEAGDSARKAAALPIRASILLLVAAMIRRTTG